MKQLAAVGSMKLSFYLKNKDCENLFKEYSHLLNKDIAVEMMSYYSEDPQWLFPDNIIQRGRYRCLYEYLNQNATALCALQLALLATMDANAYSIFSYISPACKNGLTLDIASKIAHPSLESFDVFEEVLEAKEKLQILFPALCHCDDFLHTPFHADMRLVGYCYGEDTIDSRLEEIASPFSSKDSIPPLYLVSESLRKEVEDYPDFYHTKPFHITHISGEEHNGQKLIAKHLAASCHLDLLFISFDLLTAQKEDFALFHTLIRRELLFHAYALCFQSVPYLPKEQNLFQRTLKQLLKDYVPLNRPCFFLTTKNVKLLPLLDVPFYMITVPSLSNRESEELWQLYFQALRTKLPFQVSEVASKLMLPSGLMKRIADITAEKFDAGTYLEKDIYRICYQILDDGRYDSIKRVDTKYAWEDLKVGARQRETLNKICNQVEYRACVMDEWDLRKKYQYGRSVSAIFTGPPGTGKTMAVYVIAQRLGLEVFKVDLSQVVDKYIGETEKHLEEIFTRAEKSNMILFFDEADSILGKRSEIKESKDKYANTEVSYLLQRMEEYDGIVIMATNYRVNIDAAFIRRFRFEVPFTMPDDSLRLEIWQSLLTNNIPMESIDFEYLAKEFELSGAVIKNIVLNACYEAAADKGCLEMKHLLLSLRNELQKEGRVMTPADFKQYGIYLSDSAY